MSPIAIVFGFVLLFTSHLANSGSLLSRLRDASEARLAPGDPPNTNKDIFIEMKFYVENKLLQSYQTSETRNKEVFIKELLAIITEANRSLRKIGVHIVILDIVFLDAGADEWSINSNLWHFKFQEHLRKSIAENTNVRDAFDSVMLLTASNVGSTWRSRNGWMCYDLSNVIVSLMRDAITPVGRDKAGWLIASAIGGLLSLEVDENCRDCIMTPEVNWNRVETEWSPGDRENLNGRLTGTTLDCIDASPSIARTSMYAICGNGLLEQDSNNVVNAGQKEICDCVATKADTDDECACCDASTCQYKQVGKTVVLVWLCSFLFKAGNECDATEIRIVGYCDLGGFCGGGADGKPVKCSPSQRENGTQCSDGKTSGTCHAGICRL